MRASWCLFNYLRGRSTADCDHPDIWQWIQWTRFILIIIKIGPFGRKENKDKFDYPADPVRVKFSLTYTFCRRKDMDVLRKTSAFATEVLDVFDRSLSEKELVSQSKALCRDYILFRLNQNGLGWARTEINFSPNTNTTLAEVSLVLLCLGDELECIQPSLYRNVARQLNISVAMENAVSDAFLGVATEIFSAGITWGKVVSMYAVAGALAVDCVRQGYPTTVHVLVDSLGQFVCKFLVPWLKRRGGWVEINKCVVRMDFAPERHWLSFAIESLKYFLTTLYVCVMKEQ